MLPIHAYALGCAAKDDLDKINDLVLSGGDFPASELGEFQNLAALLPSILNLETPAPEVKDKVARKLYRIQEEIKKKSSKVSKSGEMDDFPAPPPPQEPVPAPPIVPEPGTDKDIESVFEEISSTQQPKDISEEFDAIDKQSDSGQKNFAEEEVEREIVADQESDEYEVVTPKKRDLDFIRPSQETQIRGRLGNELSREKPVEKSREEKITSGRMTDESEEVRKAKKTSGSQLKDSSTKSRTGMLIITIFVIVIISGAVYALLKLTENIDSYKSEVNQLNGRIDELQNQVLGDEVLNRIMNSQGLFIAELVSPDTGMQTAGKAFLSSESGEVVFRIEGITSNSDSTVYAIWISSGDGSYRPIVSFNAEEPAVTLSATLNSSLIASGNEIKITEESDTAAERPGKATVLQGVIR